MSEMIKVHNNMVREKNLEYLQLMQESLMVIDNIYNLLNNPDNIVMETQVNEQNKKVKSIIKDYKEFVESMFNNYTDISEHVFNDIDNLNKQNESLKEKLKIKENESKIINTYKNIQDTVNRKSIKESNVSNEKDEIENEIISMIKEFKF